MAIYSPNRKLDLSELAIWAEIIESTHNAYKKTGKEVYKEHRDMFIERYQYLKERLNHHDYGPEDQRYWAAEAFFQRLSTGDST